MSGRRDITPRVDGWLSRWDVPGVLSDDVAELAALLRFARDGDVEAAGVDPRDPAERLAALVALDPEALAAAFSPGTLADDEWVGLPAALWERLLRASGRVEAPAQPLRGADADEPHGAARGGWEEWWGDGAHPGAAYDGRLCAWGVVRMSPGGRPDPHPRLAWAGGAGWSCAPAMQALVRAVPGLAPPADAGPQPLLHALRETFAPLVNARARVRLRPTALAAAWAAWWLPVLAPTRLAVPLDGEPGADPPLARHLAFFALAPRVQAALVGMDRLAGLGDDPGCLAALAAELGAPDPVRLALGVLDGAATAGGLGSDLLRAAAERLADAPDFTTLASRWDDAEPVDATVTPVGEALELACGPRGVRAVSTPGAVLLLLRDGTVRLTGAPGPVRELRLDQDGGRVVVWGRGADGKARRWTAGSPREPREVPALPEGPAPGVRVEAGRAWVEADGAPVALPGEATAAARLGNRVAVGDRAGVVRVWELGEKGQAARPVAELSGHGGPITALAWARSGSGRPLWSAATDGTLRGWRLPAGPRDARGDRVRAGFRTALATPLGETPLSRWTADLAWATWSTDPGERP